jgi:hypothetical protein
LTTGLVTRAAAAHQQHLDISATALGAHEAFAPCL